MPIRFVWLISLICFAIVTTKLRRRKNKQSSPNSPGQSNSLAEWDQPNRSAKKSSQNSGDIDEKRHRLWEGRYWLASSILTFLVGIGALLSVFYAYKAVSAAQGQLTAMRDDQRPWIGGPVVTKNAAAWTNETAAFSLTFTNVGKTPPNGLYIGTDIVTGAAAYTAAENICNRGVAEASILKSAFSEFTILPDDPFVVDNIPDVTVLNKNVSEIEKMVDPHIVGCVVYRIPSDNTLRRTTFYTDIAVTPIGVTILHHHTYSLRAN